MCPKPTVPEPGPHHQQDTGKNHLPRVRQILKAVVMPQVGAEDEDKGEAEAEVHKEIQTQIQNLHPQ